MQASNYNLTGEERAVKFFNWLNRPETPEFVNSDLRELFEAMAQYGLINWDVASRLIQGCTVKDSYYADI